MNKELSDIVVKADDVIGKLTSIREELYPQLKDISVSVDREFDHTIDRALTSVFPESEDAKSGKITFEMYIQCLKIAKMAGEIKGTDHVRGKNVS